MLTLFLLRATLVVTLAAIRVVILAATPVVIPASEAWDRKYLRTGHPPVVSLPGK